LTVCLLSACFFSGAQTLDEISKMMSANNLKGAKTAIDAYLGDPKNAAKSDGWYYKGRVYNALSYDSTATLDQNVSYKLEAFDAFKKTQQLDAQDLRMKLESHRSYLALYYSLFDVGATLYNTKKYDESYNAFTKAHEVKEYILAKRITYTDAKIYPLDTGLVLNMALAAKQSKKEDLAIKYYKQLADANVAGKGYEEIYENLVAYYYDKNDQGSLQPILVKAKMLYPNNSYWSELELKDVKKSGNQAALFVKYEEMIVKNPNDFLLPYNYSIELYNSLYSKDAKPENAAANSAKLTNYLKMAIAIDKGNDATILMSNHLFNAASDLSIAASIVKGTKPEDVKKRKDLTLASNKMMDEFIPYAEKAIKYFESQPTIKPEDKAKYRILLVNMSDVYNAKKDPKKAAEYDKKKAKAI
ncbi:MAG: hypothetical protein ABIP80_03825, partial [Ferruginibacter sp.]